jgi:pyrroline-5-carboxylate reductase
MKKKVLLVGLGAMGSAMASVWKNTTNLLCIDPASDDGLRTIDEIPQTYVPQIIVLAIKPQVMGQVLSPYAERFQKYPITWVSVAAGLPISFFQKFLSSEAIIARAMPNLPFQFGQGVTCLYSNSPSISHVEDLFAAGGYVTCLEKEEDLNKVTAISGSGPAYFYYMVETLIQSAINLGLPFEQAQSLARQTLIGAAATLEKTLESPQTLRAKVTSPKGTTEAALKCFLGSGSLQKLMQKAVTAAFERSQEIEKLSEY